MDVRPANRSHRGINRSTDLQQRLAETSLLLEVLSQVNTLIAQMKSFEDFCAKVADILHEKFNFKYIHIWIRDEEDPSLLRLATPEHYGRARTTTTYDGIVGKTVRENVTVCAPDARRDPDYRSVHEDTVSELCIPLNYEGKTIGALNIESETPQDFSSQRELLELIAANLVHSMKIALFHKTKEKLNRAERFLASITQSCVEAIIGLDTSGIVQSWNLGAEQIFGYTAAEMIGASIQRIIPEEHMASGEMSQFLNDVAAKGMVKNFETTRLHKNGAPISIALTGSALKDGAGDIVGISALHRDITPQKKWERELQNRFEKMQEAYKEMGRQRRYLDYLSEMITMAADETMTRKQIANFAVNAIAMLTRVDGVTLRLLDSEKGRLFFAASMGLSEEWLSKKAIPYQGSLLETAVLKGQPLKILDILSSPQYTSPSLARKNGLRSALILPLKVRDSVLGSLVLYLSHEGNLSLLDDEFIEVFAKQAAITLSMSRIIPSQLA